MECPDDVKQMFEGLARVWDESYDDWDEAVKVDGYNAVWWTGTGIGYSPAMDPNHQGEEHGAGDHFIITRDDLRMLIREPGYLPALIALLDGPNGGGGCDCDECRADHDHDEDDEPEDDEPERGEMLMPSTAPFKLI